MDKLTDNKGTKSRENIKKATAVLLIVVAIVNLTLLALRRIEPSTFIVTLTFIALISYIYYKKPEDTESKAR
ncbi:MAG: hypothetical protein ACOCUR_01410 [Nanoarchaeota archaeon]